MSLAIGAPTPAFAKATAEAGRSSPKINFGRSVSRSAARVRDSRAAREGRLAVINCQGKKEFWDRAKYPPGAIGKVEPGTMSYYH